MSNTLAIGAVSATLRQLLGKASLPLPGDPLSDPDMADAFVTCKPLDVARDADDTKNQLNLFLYQMLANAAFRNMPYTGTTHDGEDGQQPLALNLYYVLTAYGAGGDEVKAHRLLGRGMTILHDSSTISRDALRAAMPDCDIWQQVERVRLSPHALTTDELSKLWTGFSKPYRLSVGYEVSVVLIESTKPVRAALPVLSRGTPNSGIEPGPQVSPMLGLPYPVIEGYSGPLKRPAGQLGDPITFTGKNLGGTAIVAHFSHRLLASPIDVVGTAQHAEAFTVQIPNTPTVWPAGLYTMLADVTTDKQRTTNSIAFTLAPRIKAVTKTLNPFDTLVEVICEPNVRPEQKVALIVGDRLVAPEPHGNTDTLMFKVENPPTGLVHVRLRVDGVDSLLITDYTKSPPQFDPAQSITLP